MQLSTKGRYAVMAMTDLAGRPEGATKPWEDQDGLHDIYRSWRAVTGEYFTTSGSMRMR